MVEYSEVARFASHAYVDALLESEDAAIEAAKRAAESLGLGECMAQEVAEQISQYHRLSATRSAESF